MPRYFFHLHLCGTVVADPEGSDMETPEKAHAFATVAARDVMSAEVSQGRLCLGCCIVVEDDSSNEVLRVPFRDALAITGLK